MARCHEAKNGTVPVLRSVEKAITVLRLLLPRSRAGGQRGTGRNRRRSLADCGQPSVRQVDLSQPGILPLSVRYRAKALGVDTERRVELTAVVLKRDRCGQLDDLRFGVVVL